MSNTLDVRPKGGVQVRKEDGTLVPSDGCAVPNNTYYRRRIKDGDLVPVDVKTEKKGDK